MFICTLDHETPVTALHGNGEFIYQAAVGYDDENGHVFSAMVIYSPLAGYGDGTGYELVFRIVEAALDQSYVRDYNDGTETRHVISERFDRGRVFDLILHLVGVHIDEMRPPRVDMMTHTENLPPAALRKFHEIAALFREKGYQAGPADPWHGRWIWMMRIPEDETPSQGERQ